MRLLIRIFWPFGQFEQSIEGQPEHLHESIRMKNRWRAYLLGPFLIRWALLTGVLGLSLDLVGGMDKSILNWLIWMVLWTSFAFGIAMTGLLFWLSSMRLKG